MGAHSNYVSVASDTANIILICGIVLIAILIYIFCYLMKAYHFKLFKAELRRAQKGEKKRRQKKMAHTKTVDNFYRNRIHEDVMDNKKELSTKSITLVQLYQEEY
jgi:predicted membrane protein